MRKAAAMRSAVLHEVSGQALEILTNDRDIVYKAASCQLEATTMSEPALRALAQGPRRSAKATPKVAINE